MLQAEFFFDFSCPWSYLACIRLREAALRTGARILWRPFELSDLRAEFGTRSARLAADPAAAAWQLQDLDDWADYCAVALRLPEDWPQSARPALLGAVHAIEAGRADAFVSKTFQALYGEQRDVREVSVLRDLATATGVDPDALELAIAEQAGLAVLDANAAELQSRGGFRSATLFVGQRMFCGNSRMPLVEFALGQASDRQFVMPGQHS